MKKKIPAFQSALLAGLGVNFVNNLLKDDAKAAKADPKKIEAYSQKAISDCCPYIASQKGDIYFITMGSAMIGRSAYNDLSIPNDRNVSRAHCRIFMSNGKYYIVDFGAKTRTKVNGKDVPLYKCKLEKDIFKCPLNDGDKITIGKNVYEFHLASNTITSSDGDDDFNTTTIMD